MTDPQKSAGVREQSIRQEENKDLDAFEQASKEYMDKSDGIDGEFTDKAKMHIDGIARAKAAGDHKAMMKCHERLDSAVHVFAGKRPGE